MTNANLVGVLAVENGTLSHPALASNGRVARPSKRMEQGQGRGPKAAGARLAKRNGTGKGTVKIRVIRDTSKQWKKKAGRVKTKRCT